VSKRSSQQPGRQPGGQPDAGASSRTSGESVLGAARPDVPMSPQRPDVPQSPQRPAVPETTPRPRKAPAPRQATQPASGAYTQSVDEDALKVEAPSPASFRTMRDLISDRVHGYARERRADEMEVERRAAHWKRNRALAVLAVGIAITFALHVFGLVVALDESPSVTDATPGVRAIVASIPPGNPGSKASVEEARAELQSLQKASGVIQLDAQDGGATVTGVGVPDVANNSVSVEQVESREPVSADDRIAELLRRADELLKDNDNGNGGADETQQIAESAPSPAVPDGDQLPLAKTYPVESATPELPLAETYPVESDAEQNVPVVETVPVSEDVVETVEPTVEEKPEQNIAETVAVVEEPTAEEVRAARIADLLARADSNLNRRRLTTPANENAYDLYLSVVALDPNNVRALAGVEAIHGQYVSWAREAEDAGQREKALANYEKALGVNPDDIETIRRIAELSQPVVQLASARPAASATTTEVTSAVAKAPAVTLAVAAAAPATESKATPAMRVARQQLNERGITADAYTLLESADHGDYDSVKLLLESGMSPDMRAGKYGFSPLILAAIRGDTGIVSLLLQRGAEVDTRSNDGRTALMAAAWNGHQSIVQSLLAAGSSPDIANQDGWTAMHYAAWQGHAGIVGMLIDRGADPGRRNSDGWDVAQTAEQQGFIRVIELIQARSNG